MFSALKKLVGSEQGPAREKPIPAGLQSMNQALQRRFAKGVQYNMKIVIRGDRNTGKTALWHRLQGHPFAEAYVPTPEIQVTSIHWNYKTTDDVVKVEVWDVVDKGRSKRHGEGLKLENEPAKAEVAAPALDAEFLDVYKNCNGTVMVFDITKQWTFEYVLRELPKVPHHIPVCVLGNHRDMGEHRVVLPNDVRELIRKLDRPPGASYIRYAEASMKDSFGLKYLHKFFNIPFLQLQRETLLRQLETNQLDIDATLEELSVQQETEDQNYEIFLEALEARTRAAASVASDGRSPSPPMAPSPSNNPLGGSSPQSFPAEPLPPEAALPAPRRSFISRIFGAAAEERPAPSVTDPTTLAGEDFLEEGFLAETLTLPPPSSVGGPQNTRALEAPRGTEGCRGPPAEKEDAVLSEEDVGRPAGFAVLGDEDILPGLEAGRRCPSPPQRPSSKPLQPLPAERPRPLEWAPPVGPKGEESESEAEGPVAMQMLSFVMDDPDFESDGGLVTAGDFPVLSELSDDSGTEGELNLQLPPPPIPAFRPKDDGDLFGLGQVESRPQKSSEEDQDKPASKEKKKKKKRSGKEEEKSSRKKNGAWKGKEEEDGGARHKRSRPRGKGSAVDELEAFLGGGVGVVCKAPGGGDYEEL